MRLPEVAAELRQLATQYQINRLAFLADEIARRPVLKRAKNVSTPCTPFLRAQIRAYVKAHPSLSQRAVAQHFNVNPGRVSESLRGKRE